MIVLDHAMHREFFEVTLDAIDGLINHTHRIAVGTTSLRVIGKFILDWGAIN